MNPKTLISCMILCLLMLNPINKVSAQTEKSKQERDSIKCLESIAVYSDYFKHWKKSEKKNLNINGALPYWRYAFKHCPKLKKRTFVDGETMYRFLISREKDKIKRNALIDTLMLIYDTRIKYFGEEGKVLARKGVSYYNYNSQDVRRAYHFIKESVELLKEKSKRNTLELYFKLSMKMVKENKAETSLISNNYEQIINLIDINLRKSKKNAVKSKWEKLKNKVEINYEEFATADEIITLYSGKLTESPGNIDLLKKVTGLLEKKDRREHPFYLQSKLKLYELEPDPVSAYYIGKVYLSENKFDSALNYLINATEETNSDKLADIYYYIGYCYFQLKKYPETRKYARKALKCNPNIGKAYMIIGDCYAVTAKTVGNDDFTSRAVYWAAVDKYYQAKKVDPSISESANQRINDYKKQFPTMDAIFFSDLKENEIYLVEGWINEKTKVRALKK